MLMSTKVTLDEMYPLISEQIKNGGSIRFSPNGTSMLPFIRQGIDEVVLTQKNGRLKKYDIAFYLRKNGSYILHRVVKFDSKKNYVFRGDHQFEYEYGIKDEDIIAKVDCVYRSGKRINANSFFFKLWAIFGSLYFRIKYRINKLRKLLEK